jgi:O-antigen/teichoic acid export membrane protein
VQATDARRTYALETYLGLRLVGIGLALVAIVVLASGYDAPSARVIVAVGLAKGVEAVSDVLFGRLQQGEDLRRIALSQMAKGVTSVVVVASVVVLTRDVAAAALALAGAWIVVLLAVDLPAAKRLESTRPSFRLRPLASLAWLALPLGGVMGLNALMVSVPRYAVEDALGATALGHFAALAYLLVAVNQPMLALGAATSPRLARCFAHDRAAYRRVTRQTLLLAVAFGVAAIAGATLLGGPVLAILYTPEYARHANVLVWLALAATAGMSASAFGYALTAARRFPQQLLVALAGVLVCALASHWLVPRYGLVGAAWAVLATELCRLSCLVALYRSVSRTVLRAPGGAQAADEAAAMPFGAVAGAAR